MKYSLFRAMLKFNHLTRRTLMNEPIAKLTQRVTLGCHRAKQRRIELVVVAFAARGRVRSTVDAVGEGGIQHAPWLVAEVPVFASVFKLCKRAIGTIPLIDQPTGKGSARRPWQAAVL